jgi:hypothetical protein
MSAFWIRSRMVAQGSYGIYKKPEGTQVITVWQVIYGNKKLFTCRTRDQARMFRAGWERLSRDEPEQFAISLKAAQDARFT